MTQKVSLGEGSIAGISRIVDCRPGNGLFLVTGGESFHSSGAAAAVSGGLKQCRIVHFTDFAVNPEYEDLLRGISLFRQQRIDAVLAVGGGSVMDMAKLIAVLAAQRGEALHYIDGPGLITEKPVPLVAVPTTAGSGSEATRFAVVYRDGVKQSLCHDHLLPGSVIIDPVLTYSLSPYLTAVTGFDAFSHAVESWWSVNSTDLSRRYSREAIRLILEHLIPAVENPTPADRFSMAKAAYLAGRAIDITKTTACHAVSYALTANFGVPHGQAVCFTLPWFLEFNSGTGSTDAVDSRGSRYVRESIRQLCLMLRCASAEEARDKIIAMMTQAGLATTFAGLGLEREKAISTMISNINLERAGNNPRKITPENLGSVLGKIR